MKYKILSQSKSLSHKLNYFQWTYEFESKKKLQRDTKSENLHENEVRLHITVTCFVYKTRSYHDFLSRYEEGRRVGFCST